MKNAPFSLSILLYLIYIGTILMGALLGGIFGQMGFNNIIAGALCGFIPLPFASVTRGIIGGYFANAAEAKGKMPYAFSTGVRYTIGAVAAFVTSFLVLKFSGYGVNVVTGMFIAIITSAIVSITMLMKTSMSE